MSQRRTLGDALEITAEKLSFIENGKQDERGDLEGPREAPSATLPIGQSRIGDRPVAPAASQRKVDLAVSNRPLRGEVLPALVGDILVPITTRLQPRTADALRRAYLERKLAGRRDAKQQEIVEEALTNWLREEGFLVEPDTEAY